MGGTECGHIAHLKFLKTVANAVCCIGPLLRCFNGCELGCRFSADFISDLQLPPCIKMYSFFELQLHLSSVLWVDFKSNFLEKYFDFYPKFGFQISWGLHAKIYKLKMHCPQPSSLYLCALWNWLKLFVPGMLITLCRDVMLGRHVTHFWWVGI